MQFDITTEQLDALIAEGKPIIIDFHATWCGPCKMFSPIFDRIAGEHADDIVFVKNDVDIQPEVAERYDIMTVPAVVALKNGEPVHVSNGMMNEPSLNAVIEKLV